VRLATELTSAGAPATEQYQIPVESGKIEEPAGWEDEKVMQITVPPSEKPTTLYVKKKKATLRETILPMKADKAFDMVSDNPGAKASEETATPWWYWGLGILAALGLGWFLVGKYLAPIKAFGGVAWTLVSRLFRR